MANTAKEKKAKKGFKMPHLLWIMIGLLVVASLATYIIPAGQFATDPETGKIIGDQFSYLPEQTPVSILGMLMLLHTGLVSSGFVGYLVLVGGAMTAVLLGTGAIDEFMNWAIYKLRNQDPNILIGGMFCLMVYLGAFGGNDSMIAVVPIGILFAKKVKMDPIVAMGVTTFATLLGFGTGPTKQLTTQLMMGVTPYGTFITMFISMNVFMLLGLYFVLSYCSKIRKDPTKSLMYDLGWRPDAAIEENEDDLIKEVKLTGKSIAIILVFLLQFVFYILYPILIDPKVNSYALITAGNLIVSIIMGLIGGFSFDKLGDTFAKGVASMAFVTFVIGLATVLSQILSAGNILHTIVYSLTQPLMGLSRGIASVGITLVIGVVNILIPSASAKVAILVPILQPVFEALGMIPELGVQAFQYGDGFTNMISPMLGWTVGSLAMTGIPFDKWFKWAMPKVIGFMLLSYVIMFGLTTMGWSPF